MGEVNLAGQLAGFIAFGLCIVAFASRDDDRLLLALLFANVAFTAQYLFFGAMAAAGVTTVNLLRILLARRYYGSRPVLVGVLVATGAVTAFNWQGPLDFLPLAAGFLGTVAMLALRGIPMRACLAAAALCWLMLNISIGSVGATVAELLALATNLTTMARLASAKRREDSSLSVH